MLDFDDEIPPERLVSYTSEELRAMNPNGLPEETLRRIDATDIDSIDDSDLGPDFWENSFEIPPHSQPEEIFIEPETTAWFKTKGNAYHMKINEALKAYIEANSDTQQ